MARQARHGPAPACVCPGGINSGKQRAWGKCREVQIDLESTKSPSMLSVRSPQSTALSSKSYKNGQFGKGKLPPAQRNVMFSLALADFPTSAAQSKP